MINRSIFQRGGFRRGGVVVALAVAGALTLTACGDDGTESSASQTSVSAGQESNSGLKDFEVKRSETSESPTPSAPIDSPEVLLSLEADSQLLSQVSDSIINDSSVSQTTRDTATQLAALLAEQQPVIAEKLGEQSGTGQATMDKGAVNRVLNDSGPHADMAYLTILEANLGRLSESWAAFADSSSGDAQLADQARDWSQRLGDLHQQVRKRLTA